MSLVPRLLLAAALSALAPAAAVALDCPLGRGVWTAVDFDDDMSADAGTHNDYEVTVVALKGGDDPVGLRLTEKKQQKSYDFAIARPPGFGGTHLVMVAGAEASRKKRGTADEPRSRLLWFGDDMRRLDPTADPAAKAPTWLQMPEISPAFWAWKRDDRRFVPPDGLWKLTACR